MKELLLITPPFTQLNTPYPATAYLKGFLNTKLISSFQIDLGIEVILEILSENGLKDIFNYAENRVISDSNLNRIYSLRQEYIATINPVIEFLQGKNKTISRLICSQNFLPQASRFQHLDDMEWAFGTMGIQDKAKHFATLYLEDISDFIRETIDENFGFSRYAERLGRSANSFDEIYNFLQMPQTYIDSIALHILEKNLKNCQPKLVLISVPFPGNLYSAFRCAKYIKEVYPEIKIAMGGGFPNTELRSIKDKRVFKFFDFITLDDGELPVELLYNHVCQSKNCELDDGEFKRTFLLQNDLVVYKNNTAKLDYKQKDLGTPDYSDLHLENYISVIEIANPMHSLWSDGRWNKLTMAHGCYWGKCTFCDISLDYIKLYEPVAAKILVDRMEIIIAQTGDNGFHFVDEAAPPALMRDVAIEILRRKLVVSWWTNIRFEKSFTHDLCQLLQTSGCIAVSGGLEVASDRLLDLIKKGVTIEQVAAVTRNFTEAGIMVHAYLMYGYPTQTIQETIDSLEVVRQLFEQNILQSGFWHQFAMTAHSPVGMSPDDYGVLPEEKEIFFANNDIQFKDKTGLDHNLFSFGLKKSLFNYMHGICIDYDLQEWFDFKIPNTTISPDYILSCLEDKTNFEIKSSAKIIWIGGHPISESYLKSRKGKSWEMTKLTFHNKRNNIEILLEKDKAEWLINSLGLLSIFTGEIMTFAKLKLDFEKQFDNFELFWYSKPLLQLRRCGLLTV